MGGSCLTTQVMKAQSLLRQLRQLSQLRHLRYLRQLCQLRQLHQHIVFREGLISPGL